MIEISVGGLQAVQLVMCAIACGRNVCISVNLFVCLLVRLFVYFCVSLSRTRTNYGDYAIVESCDRHVA